MRTPLLLASILVLLPACTSLERPEVIITNITPLESTLFEQRLQVDLRMQNPNDVEIPVRGLDVKLDVNKIRLARGVSGEAFIIPPFGEAETTIVTSTSVFDLMQQLTLLTGPPEVSYDLTGRVHLDQAFGPKLRFERSGFLQALRPGAGGESVKWLGITGFGADADATRGPGDAEGTQGPET